MSRANPKASGRPPAGLRQAQGGPIRQAQGGPGRKGVGGLASLFQGRRHLGNLRESQGPARRRRTEFRGNCGARPEGVRPSTGSGQGRTQDGGRNCRSKVWLLATRYWLLATFLHPIPSPQPNRNAPFSSGNKARVLPCQLSKYATRCCNIRRDAPRGTPSRIRRMLSFAESSCASTRRSKK